MTLDSLPDLDTSGLCLVKTLSTARRVGRIGTRRSGTAPEHPRALRRSPKGGRPRYTPPARARRDGDRADPTSISLPPGAAGAPGMIATFARVAARAPCGHTPRRKKHF